MDKYDYSYNYKINSLLNAECKLDVDTFCPYHTLDIKLNICSNPQHDGHGWPFSFLREETNKLIDQIMVELKEHVTKAVNKCNPYGIHYFGKEKL